MISKWEGRYRVEAGGVLVLAPSRRPWTLGLALDGAGSYAVEITATPAAQIDGATGVGGYWELLETGWLPHHIPCDYAVTGLRVTLTGTGAWVGLCS